MTTKPPPEDDAGDDVGKDAEIIDRLLAGEPPRSPEEAAAREPYEQLYAQIRAYKDPPIPAEWQDELMARWAAVQRRRRIRIALGTTVAAAAAAAAAILIPMCGVLTTTPALQVAINAPVGTVRRGDHTVGDVLHAEASIDRAHVELRVYLVTPLSTRLVVRCPGSEACQRSATGLVIDWKLAEPGTYQIVRLSSTSDLPPPGEGTLDRDLLDARKAGASSLIERVVVSP